MPVSNKQWITEGLQNWFRLLSQLVLTLRYQLVAFYLASARRLPASSLQAPRACLAAASTWQAQPNSSRAGAFDASLPRPSSLHELFRGAPAFAA